MAALDLRLDEKLRQRYRRWEIEREFEKAQERTDPHGVRFKGKKSQPTEDDPAEWPAADHAMFMSPWRERLSVAADGEIRLSPYYGPPTAAAYERAISDYTELREAGSLWDPEEAAKHGPRKEAAKLARVRRPDHDAVESLWRRQQATIPERERQVLFAFWRDMRSYGWIAKSMNVTVPTVKTWVRRIRERLSKPGARWADAGATLLGKVGQ